MSNNSNNIDYLDLKESNQYVIDLIKSNKPFVISRLGSEIIPTLHFLYDNNLIVPEYIVNNAGIYSKSESKIEDYLTYYKAYYNAIDKSDAIATFKILSHISREEDFFVKKKNKQGLSYKVLEPFYSIMENDIPWTHLLKDKKVLVISPFVVSFIKQLNNNFKMFKNQYIFLPGQRFIFYKSFNTSSHNYIHNNWIETFSIMCSEIEKLEFDIALISCGGYGMPICDFIKDKLNKSSIYIGGGMQLLFGVIGRRWDNDENIQKIIKENECVFIRPSEDEIIKNSSNVEGGCYW